MLLTVNKELSHGGKTGLRQLPLRLEQLGCSTHWAFCLKKKKKKAMATQE